MNSFYQLKRKALRVVLLVVLLVFVMPPKAFSDEVFPSGRFRYTITGSNTVMLVDCPDQSTTGAVIIPSSIFYNQKYYNVTSIRYYAFTGCTGITGVSIPNTVTTIGKGAFYGCSNLSGTLIIPESVTQIGTGAFAGTGFSTVEFNALNCEDYSNVIYHYDTVACYGPFGACPNLKTIRIGENVHHIPVNMFYGCSTLGANGMVAGIISEAIFPPSVGEKAFYSVNSNIMISVPCGSKTDYQSAVGWANFTSYTETGCVNIEFEDDLVKSICVANWDTNGDGELSTIEAAAVTHFGGVFAHQPITSFNELSFFTGLSFVGQDSNQESSFIGCVNLQSVVLPEGLTSIGVHSFRGCVSLTEIRIPSSVQNIDVLFDDSNPFCFCSSLERIVVDEDNPYYDSRNNCNAIIETGTDKLIVGCKTTQVPNTVKTIGIGAFYGIPITSVQLPNSLLTIEGSAFCDSYLELLEIPSSVSEIQAGIVNGCHNMEQIVVDEDNPYYDSRNNCNAIIETRTDKLLVGCKNTVIPNTINTIGEASFNNMQITSIQIPNSVVEIEELAFCQNAMETIELPNSLVTIGDEAFFGNRLETITIPASVTSMGYAFGPLYDLDTVYGLRLKSITLQCNTPPTLLHDMNVVEAFDIWDTIPVTVPCGSVETYLNTPGWNVVEFVYQADSLCTHETTANTNNEEGGTATGSGTYIEGNTCTFEAVANEGYAFTRWIENRGEVSTEPSYSFIVTGDRTLTANFAPIINVTVTASPYEGGSVSYPDTFVSGEEYTVTATSNEGYLFLNWQKDGVIVSADTSYTFVVDEACALVANFVELVEIEGVYIGDCGTSSTNYFPSCTDYKYSLTQQIYTADEINVIGDIKSIAFFNAGDEKTRNYSIYFKETEREPFSSGWIWETITENDLVFCGNVTMAFGEWTVIVLDSVFHYNGYSNLVVRVDDNTGVASNGMKCRYIQGKSIKRSGYSDVNPFISGEEFQNRFNIKNQIIFDIDIDENLNSYTFDVDLSANQENCCTLSEGGTYHYGDTCTAFALPNEGFEFVNWTENGIEVSRDKTYSFIVHRDCNLIANFNYPIYIGEGDEYTDVFPSRHYSSSDKYSMTQQLFTADEINFIGDIKSIAFYSKHAKDRNFDIYFKLTDKSVFNSNKDWVTVTDEDLVFSGNVTLKADGRWTVITLNEPFAYDGISNLVVVVDDNSNIGSSTVQCRMFQTEEYQSIIVSGSTNYNPKNPSSYSGTRYGIKNQIKLDVDVNENVTYAIQAASDPEEFGIINGSGTYHYGDTCNIVAVANEGYEFLYWVENGEVVSTNANYSFVVRQDHNLIAKFVCPIHIGSGETVSSYLPSYSGNKYSLTQQIYTAEEIDFLGEIKSIAFYNKGSEKTRNFSIYLKTTDKTAFTGSNDWISVASDNLVFSGDVVMAANRWTLITLDSPFAYDGISNLVVCIDDNTGNSMSGMQCRVFNSVSYQSLYIYGSTNYNPSSLTSYGSRGYSKNQILFDVEKSAAIFDVTLTANNENRGAVSGDGAFGYGDTCVVSATPNVGYEFFNWTENGKEVSIDLDYVFVVRKNCDLVANFIYSKYIGEGESTIAVLPSTSQDNYSFTQQIYTVEELNFVGNINSLAFYNEGGRQTRNVDIYLKTTEKREFEDEYAWITVSGEDMVFSGDVTMEANRWTLITFDTPFAYDGASNLVLCVDDNTGSSTSSNAMTCRSFDVDCRQSLYYNSGWNNYGPSDISYGYRSYSKNQLMLDIEKDEDATFNIIVLANDDGMGTVAGGGNYNYGDTCALEAYPNDGYTLFNWTKNGVEVSRDSVYSFVVRENSEIFANFIYPKYVGEVYTTDQYLPTYTKNDYSLTQQIYTAEELGFVGYIKRLAFYNQGEEITRECKIYLKMTTKESFENSTDWILVSDENLVYSGPVTMLSNKWTMIDLDVPFAYNGRSNLLVVVNDNTARWYNNGISCRVYQADDNQSIYYHNGYAINPGLPSYFDGTLRNVKNNLLFDVELDDGLSNLMCDIDVAVADNYGGTVSGGGAFYYGEPCTVTATADEGYIFINWLKDGVEVSRDAEYSFIVTENQSLMAHFICPLIVGVRDSVSDDFPSYTYANYSLTQQIYTPDDIDYVGEIKSISLYNEWYETTRNYNIYLKLTDKEVFENNMDWITVSENDLVFSGSVKMTPYTWREVVLNEPFEYDGTSNLAIIIDDNTGARGSLIKCRAFDANGAQSIRVCGSNTDYDPLNPSSYNGTLLSVKNQIVFGTGINPAETSFVVNAMPDNNAGGTISGSDNYYFGETCTLTATANEGYEFCYWTRSGKIVSVNASYSFPVTNHCEFVACFKEISSLCNVVFNLESDSYGGWNGNGLLVNYGDSCMERMTIKSGAHSLSNVRKIADGNHVSLTWITGPSISSDYSFSVQFDNGVVIYQDTAIDASLQYEFDLLCAEATAVRTINATADPVEYGTISGTGDYESGAMCTLTASPNEGYCFCYWTEGGNVISYNGVLTFLVETDRNFVAHFITPLNVQLSLNNGDWGSVSGNGFYNYNDTCTVTATPSEGFYFANWTENGLIVSYDEVYSFVVRDNRNLVANFMSPTYIGDNETTNSSLPSGSSWKYYLTQQIYTADDIGFMGTIKRLAFYNTGGERTRNFDIYLKMTDKSKFESGNDWITVAEEDLVFSGEVVMMHDRWTIITLITPFSYDGFSNLVIVVDDNTGSWDNNGINCHVYHANDNQSIFVSNDNVNFDPFNPLSYSGTLSDEKNQLMLDVEIDENMYSQTYNVSVIADGDNGLVSGNGIYHYGDSCTVTAMPNAGLQFLNWTENGDVVSTDAEFSFVVRKDYDLVANFICPPIIVGEGDLSDANLPSHSFWKYSLSQQIYTAEELGFVGDIKSVAFFNAGTEQTRNYNIYFKTIDKVTFSSAYDWVAVNENDLVFSGNVTMSHNQWTVITLDVAYTYVGSNLLVVVDDNTGSYSSGMQCRVFETVDNQAVYVHSDGANYDPCNPTSYSGTLLSTKNQMLLYVDTDVLNTEYTVNVFTESGGVVSGGGTYLFGNTCTVTATPNYGYNFINWTENGVEVSTESNYSFIVSQDRNLVANFICPPIYVGSGDSDNSYLPSYSGGKYAMSQQIYLADELDFVGNIKSIAFYNAGTEKTRNYNIYFKTTDYTTFDNNSDWEAVAENDLVFSGVVTMLQNQWTVITLDSSFRYEGSNLLITVDDNTGSSSYGMRCKVYDAGNNQAIYIQGSTNYNPLDHVTNGSRLSIKNQIRFEVEIPEEECLINAIANSDSKGSVSGGGVYQRGEVCTLSATPNEGYEFLCWTENGKRVSTSATYSFGVVRDREIKAHFISPYYVGEGGTASYPPYLLPSSDQNNYSMTQQLYMSDELDFTGYINGLAFYNEGDACVRDYNIYIVATDKESFDNNSDWVTMTGENLVYSGNVKMEHLGWTLIPLDTPFAYDGFSNIVLCVDDNTGSYVYSTDQMRCRVYDSDSFRSIYVTHSSTDYDPFNPSAYSGNRQYYKNRLLLDIDMDPAATFEITVTTDPVGGCVSGAGTYTYNDVCTLTASSTEGYPFHYWTENGTIISTDSVISFTVMQTRRFVAHFSSDDIILFDDANVKEICVSNWDTNNDGELSYAEAAAVTNLGQAFEFNEDIVSFEELRYFTGLTSIGNKAFGYCSQLSSIEIPDNVISIDNMAFRYCTSFSSIEIPSSVTSIDYWAFRFCTGLSSIYVWAETPPIVTDGAFDNVDRNIPMYVPCGSASDYQTAAVWSEFSNIRDYCEYEVLATPYPVEYGTVTGSGSYYPDQPCTLTAIPNEGQAFFCWTIDGIVVSEENPFSFDVVDDLNVVAVFAQTQSTSLVSGWNWYSTYIEQNDIDGLTMLENGLGDAGIMVKAQNSYVKRRANGSWMGNLTGVTNEDGYKINVSANCSANISGTSVVASDHPITIKPNWTWIGYPVNMQQTVVAALSEYQPVVGDMIKGAGGFAKYRSSGWMPSSFMLEPGKSYMYNSMATEDKTLVYSTSRNSVLGEETVELYWNNDIHAYPDNITMIATVNLDGEELRDDNAELGAFVGFECRGSARLFHDEETGRYLAMVTIVGEDGDMIDFGLVCEGRMIMGSETLVTFHADDMIGDFDAPKEIVFVGKAASGLKAYPNPVGRGQSVRLSLPEDESVVEVAITNTLGMLVRRDVTNRSEVPGLSVPGVYTLQVVCKSGNKYHERIIVK
ncbi:MAG: leucine-rich repeat domain-containing protein [Bacteroidales bacterium]|nr:leucine-rich repeat domain-containing protein [Bacteroidales bacterium]